MTNRHYVDLPDLCKVGLEDYPLTSDTDFDEVLTDGAPFSFRDSEFTHQDFCRLGVNQNEIFLQTIPQAQPERTKVIPAQSDDSWPFIKNRPYMPTSFTLEKRKDDDFNAWTCFKSPLSPVTTNSTFRTQQFASSPSTKNDAFSQGSMIKDSFGDNYDIISAIVSRLKDDQQKIMTFSPQEIVVYSLDSVHKEGIKISYYIEAAPGRILPKIYFFRATLRHPEGRTTSLKLKSDKVNQGRYVCSFLPIEVGHYLLSVTLTTDGRPQNVKSSPVHVQVNRDYSRYTSGSIVLGTKHQQKFLSKPWGVDVYRPMNHIYLTDRDENQIVVLNDKGKILKKFGHHGQLSRPTGIAVDAVNKRIVVTDKDNHRICVYSLDGKFLTCFGGPGHHHGQFNYPWGVAVSPDGETIAVADSRNHRLQLFDRDGKYLRKYSVFEVRPFDFKHEFANPRGVTFDHEGENMYVTDFDLHSIFKINLDCTEKKTILPQGHVERPQGITVDGSGNLLVADSKHNCVQVVSLASRKLFPLMGSGSVPFMGPLDMTVCHGGKIAAVDSSGVFLIF